MHSGKTENQRPNPKPRWGRRCAAVVGVIAVIGIAWLGIAQKNNLKALYLALTSDTEKLEQQQEEQTKKQEDILEQYGLTKPDLSQPQAPQTGTGEEAADQSSQEEAPQEKPETPAGSGGETSQTPQQSPEQTPQPETDPLQAELQGYIDQLYQVEAEYQQLLNDLVESTKKEFWSLPKEEQVSSKKMEIVRAKLDALVAQEDACDAEVEEILANIEDVLRRQGQPNDLAESIRSYYEESKASWKAAKMTELYR